MSWMLRIVHIWGLVRSVALYNGTCIRIPIRCWQCVHYYTQATLEVQREQERVWKNLWQKWRTCDWKQTTSHFHCPCKPDTRGCVPGAWIFHTLQHAKHAKHAMYSTCPVGHLIPSMIRLPNDRSQTHGSFTTWALRLFSHTRMVWRRWMLCYFLIMQYFLALPNSARWYFYQRIPSPNGRMSCQWWLQGWRSLPRKRVDWFHTSGLLVWTSKLAAVARPSSHRTIDRDRQGHNGLATSVTSTSS